MCVDFFPPPTFMEDKYKCGTIPGLVFDYYVLGGGREI